MAQGWLKEILDENRKTVGDWPEWKKTQRSENSKSENKDNTRIEKSAKGQK
jgi:hypothetical protein